MKITVEENFDSLARYLRKAGPAVIKEADKAMGRGALTMQRDARTNAPKFQSLLHNSILLRKVAPLHYVIGTGQNYAAAVEQGLRPHWPSRKPKNDFYKWVTGKLGGDERVVYLVARAISRKGTRAQPFMKPAFESNIDAVIASISRAVGVGLR